MNYLHSAESRRIDWRFLLSDHKPKICAVLSEGRLVQEARHIAEILIKPEDSEHRDVCDLVVLSTPQNDLKRAFSLLKPGGTAYVEWHNLSILSRAKIIKSNMEKAGFSDIVLYLPKPSPLTSPPKMWIPIGDAQIIKFLMNNEIDEGESRLKRFAKKIRLLLYIKLPSLFIHFPCLLSANHKTFSICTIASKPIANDEATSAYDKTGKPQSETRSIWDVVKKVIGTSKPLHQLSILMISNVNVSRKAIFYAFINSHPIPECVIKVARIKDYDHALSHESSILNVLHQNVGRGIRIPEVLFTGYSSDFFTVANSFLSGVLLSKIVNDNNYRDLADKVTSWLIEFAKQTRAESMNDSLKLHLSPSEKLSQLLSNGVLSREQADLSKELITKIRLPYLVCEHGDFAPQNILLDSDSKNELGVLDWDESTLTGLPGVDLIFFLTYLTFNLKGNWYTIDFIEIYKELLNPSSPTGNVFKDCVDRYAESLGIAQDTMSYLRHMTWLRRVQKELNGDLGKEKISAEVIQNRLHFKLYLEELRLSSK